MSGRFVTVLLYGGPILTGMTLGVVYREPVLFLLGIVAAVSVDIGRRIAASWTRTPKGGRFENGRWINMPEPPEYVGPVLDAQEAARWATGSVVREVTPRIKKALEERARKGKT